MKLDRETAEAIVRLQASNDFQTYMKWLAAFQEGMVLGAVHGVDENFSPDVLRGRAQGISIMLNEMEKASDVASRIQKVS